MDTELHHLSSRKWVATLQTHFLDFHSCVPDRRFWQDMKTANFHIGQFFTRFRLTRFASLTTVQLVLCKCSTQLSRQFDLDCQLGAMTLIIHKPRDILHLVCEKFKKF
jgi:hypothetical protein